MSQLHLEVFDKSQLTVLGKLRKFGSQMILGGGSGIALQIGHRKSYDLDIFTNKPLTPRFFRQVQDVFVGKLQKLLDTEDQLNILIENQVSLTFLHYYYPPLFPVITTQFLPIYNLTDLALDKAHTIGRRGVWRDYVDLYFLLKEGRTTLEKLIELGKKKFGSDFAPKLFLAQLTYFGDIVEYTVEYIGPRLKPEEIKTFLKEEAKRLKRKLLGE